MGRIRNLPFLGTGFLAAMIIAAAWCIGAGTSSANRSADRRASASKSNALDINKSSRSDQYLAQKPTSLEASPITPLWDSDADLLPDLLEEELQSEPTKSDSDGDGRDDFVELLEYSAPMSKDKASVSKPDAFRLLLHTTSLPAGGEIIWLHLLFRIRSGRLDDLKSLALFADIKGQKVPLNGLLTTSMAEIRQRRHPVHGLLLRVSLKLPTRKSFKQLAPLTFGAYSVIYKEGFLGGAMLLHSGSEYFTLTPLTKGVLVAQTTNATAGASPFWSSQKRCRIKLEVQGAGRHGLLCEVKSASCEASHKTSRCAPSCKGMVGGTFFVPDGLPFILGG